jgi:hypothetical protein
VVLACGESFTESTGAVGDSKVDAGASAKPASEDPEDSGVALDDAPAALADAYCSTLQRCLGPLADLFLGGDSCSGELARTFEDQGWNELSRAVEEGRVTYDGSKVPACLAALEARGCEDTNQRTIDECEAALSGTAKLGEACTVDEECEGAALCDRSASCPGECAPLHRAGEPCSADDMCVDGLACSDVTGLCARPAAAGDPCGGGVERDCQVGLFCVGDDTANGTPGECAAIGSVFAGADGDACDIQQGQLCGDGLACVVVTDAATGDTAANFHFECQPMAGPGDTCTVGLPDPCPSTHYCTARFELGEFEGTCAPLPKAGEPCQDTLLGDRCASGAVCDPDGKCVARKRLGDPCQFAAMCYSGSCVGGACTSPGSDCN